MNNDDFEPNMSDDAVHTGVNKPADEADTESLSDKVKKLNEKKPSKFSANAKKYGMIAVIAVAVVLVIGVLVAVKTLTKTDKTTYYDVLDKVVGLTKGTFSYAIDVNNTGVKPSDEDLDKYQVTISGSCYETSPANLTMDIGINTENFSDRFTTITVVDDVTYIDIEQIRYWLSHSGYDTLKTIGSSIPDGRTYVSIPSDKFSLYSPYAENGDEGNTVSSMIELIERLRVATKAVLGNVSKTMGTSGLASANGVHRLSYDTDMEFQSCISGIVSNANKFHKAVGQSLLNNGVITDTVYTSRDAESDNVLNALSSVIETLKTSDLGMNCVGSAREYTDISGVATYEASFTIQSYDYTISFTGSRSAIASQLSAPNGSIADIASYSGTDIEGVFLDVIDFLNPFDVKVRNTLSITPDKIADDIRDEFIKLVNTTSSTDARINKSNFKDFISDWVDFEVTDNSTETERVNAKLVQDFVSKLNEMTGNAVVIKVEQEIKNQQFYTISTNIKGVSIEALYDADNSTAKLTAVDLLVFNDSEDEQVLDLTKFSMQNLISSKFPANNYDILMGYDTEFDFDNLDTEVTLEPNMFKRVKLYFVTESGLEYFDLVYDGNNLGELIAY